MVRRVGVLLSMTVRSIIFIRVALNRINPHSLTSERGWSPNQGSGTRRPTGYPGIPNFDTASMELLGVYLVSQHDETLD